MCWQVSLGARFEFLLPGLASLVKNFTPVNSLTWILLVYFQKKKWDVRHTSVAYYSCLKMKYTIRVLQNSEQESNPI